MPSIGQSPPKLTVQNVDVGTQKHSYRKAARYGFVIMLKKVLFRKANQLVIIICTNSMIVFNLNKVDTKCMVMLEPYQTSVIEDT